MFHNDHIEELKNEHPFASYSEISQMLLFGRIVIMKLDNIITLNMKLLKKNISG